MLGSPNGFHRVASCSLRGNRVPPQRSLTLPAPPRDLLSLRTGGTCPSDSLRGRIEGGRLDRVVALDRAYLRDDDSVWVMTAGDRLEIRAVEIAYRGPERVYVSVGLGSGDRVVTSEIATPTNGMKLRTRGDDSRQGNGSTGGGAV